MVCTMHRMLCNSASVAPPPVHRIGGIVPNERARVDCGQRLSQRQQRRTLPQRRLLVESSRDQLPRIERTVKNEKLIDHLDRMLQEIDISNAVLGEYGSSSSSSSLHRTRVERVSE